MTTKGLESDKIARFREMALDKRHFENFTLKDILEEVLPGRSILIRIEVPEDGTRTMISIVEEL